MHQRSDTRSHEQEKGLKGICHPCIFDRKVKLWIQNQAARNVRCPVLQRQYPEKWKGINQVSSGFFFSELARLFSFIFQNRQGMRASPRLEVCIRPRAMVFWHCFLIDCLNSPSYWLSSLNHKSGAKHIWRMEISRCVQDLTTGTHTSVSSKIALHSKSLWAQWTFFWVRQITPFSNSSPYKLSMHSTNLVLIALTACSRCRLGNLFDHSVTSSVYLGVSAGIMSRQWLRFISIRKPTCPGRPLNFQHWWQL